MTNVLVVSRGADTGGQGVRIKQAFDRHGGDGWNVRAVHRADTYLKYAHDASWDDLPELYAWADLVHFKTDTLLYEELDAGEGKPVVIHWQGSYLRDNPETAVADAERIGARQLVSTVDLLECAPGAEWLPYPADLDWFASYRNPLGLAGTRPFVIAHAPTNRRVKGTQDVIDAVAQLKADGYNVELDLIERLPWKVCLSRKGRAHLFVDQLHLGYGTNAIEAWAMGMPVICGVDDEAVMSRMLATWDGTPFLPTRPETLAANIAALIDDAAERQAWADVGREHVAKYHDEKVVVEQLKRVWSETLSAHNAGVPDELLEGSAEWP